VMQNGAVLDRCWPCEMARDRNGVGQRWRPAYSLCPGMRHFGDMRYFGVLASVGFWEIERAASGRESLPDFAYAPRVRRLASGTPVVTATDLGLSR
jgi:hypothetical protein